MSSLRVLCLHDFNSNRIEFELSLCSLARQFGENVELSVLEAPLELPIVNANKHEEKTFCWFYYSLSQRRDYISAFERNTPTEYIYIEKTLAYVAEYVSKAGPFDGIIGFGQGATLACILIAEASLFQEKSTLGVSVRFAALFSGYCNPVPTNAALSWFLDVGYDDIPVPSLHAFGEMNELVLPCKSKELAKMFRNSQFFSHPGDHQMPVRRNDIDRISSFICSHGNTSSNLCDVQGSLENEIQSMQVTIVPVTLAQRDGPTKTQQESLFNQLIAERDITGLLRLENEKLKAELEDQRRRCVAAESTQSDVENENIKNTMIIDDMTSRHTAEVQNLEHMVNELAGAADSLTKQNRKLVDSLQEERSRTSEIAADASKRVAAAQADREKYAELVRLLSLGSSVEANDDLKYENDTNQSKDEVATLLLKIKIIEKERDDALAIAKNSLIPTTTAAAPSMTVNENSIIVIEKLGRTFLSAMDGLSQQLQRISST